MKHIERLARYYYVDDLPEACRQFSQLHMTIDRHWHGLSLSEWSLKNLLNQQLNALHSYITNQALYSEFSQAAKHEQDIRIKKAELVKQQREREEQEKIMAEQKEKEAREAKRQARVAKNSAKKGKPLTKSKMKIERLRAMYLLDDYIKRVDYQRVIKILFCVDSGGRISKKNYLWLCTEGSDYFSAHLKSAYHLAEAKFFEGEFRRTNDLWMAINASSHYRRGGKSEHAAELLDSISVTNWKSKKVRSAFHTTLGGVKRDLGHPGEAIELGGIAHDLLGDDFRPCTLLGAVHMEQGDLVLGQEWYAKAEERGASVKSIDSDIRQIYRNAGKEQRDKLRAFLLQCDPQRFAWIGDLNAR